MNLSPDEEAEAAELESLRKKALGGSQQALEDILRRAQADQPLSAIAMDLLGEVHSSGRLLDLAKAEQWYRARNERSRSSFSACRLGQFLRWQGQTEEAKALFREGVAEGDGRSMYWLAVALLDEPQSAETKLEVTRLLEQASEQGYVWAKRLLADRHIMGRYGVASIPKGLAMRVRLLFEAIGMAARDRRDPRLYR